VTLQRKHIYWVCGISAVIALLAIWTFAIEWEWSFIGDDAGWIIKSREAGSSGNPVDWVSYWGGLVWSDTTGWGLFRPVYHFYGLVVAPLGADLAHGVRLLMFLLAMTAPVILVWRNTQRGQVRTWAIIWILSMLFSAYTILYGIYFVSLQELTGITLVALGLITRNPFARGLLWLLAAWTKAPFIWLYLFFCISQLETKNKRIARVALGLGILTVGVFVWSATNGSYTEDTLRLSIWHFWQNIQSLGTYGAAFLIVALAGSLIFAGYFNLRRDSVVLLGGAIFYALNLLPWNAIGYYNAPVWYLAVCGLAAGINRKNMTRQHLAYKWAPAVLVVCVTASIALSAETLRTDVFGRNTMVVESRDWALTEIPTNSRLVLGNTGSEELIFYAKEANEKWTSAAITTGDVDGDYIFVLSDWPYPKKAELCPPIKVWTRGFLAPLKC
jgi:hypothetical protein